MVAVRRLELRFPPLVPSVRIELTFPKNLTKGWRPIQLVDTATWSFLMITFSSLRAETLLVGLRSHSIFHTEGYQGKKDHDEYSSRYSCFRANCRSHPLGIGVPASTKIPICFVSYHYFIYTAPTAPPHFTRLEAYAWRWQKIRADLSPATIIVFYNGLLVG